MVGEVKEHPGWKHAQTKVLEAVKEKGYGILFTHEDLKTWMSITAPKTIEEYRATEFHYLDSIEQLRKTLLEDHMMWLDNKKSEGYIVVTPDDQVESSADKLIKASRVKLKKAFDVAKNANKEMLSAGYEIIRLNKLRRIAFIQSGFRKRTLPLPQKKKQRLLAG